MWFGRKAWEKGEFNMIPASAEQGSCSKPCLAVNCIVVHDTLQIRINTSKVEAVMYEPYRQEHTHLRQSFSGRPWLTRRLIHLSLFSSSPNPRSSFFLPDQPPYGRTTAFCLHSPSLVNSSANHLMTFLSIGRFSTLSSTTTTSGSMTCPNSMTPPVVTGSYK